MANDNPISPGGMVRDVIASARKARAAIAEGALQAAVRRFGEASRSVGQVNLLTTGAISKGTRTRLLRAIINLQEDLSRAVIAPRAGRH